MIWKFQPLNFIHIFSCNFFTLMLFCYQWKFETKQQHCNTQTGSYLCCKGARNTNSIWWRAGGAYLVGEIYTLIRSYRVWFLSVKGFLSVNSAGFMQIVNTFRRLFKNRSAWSQQEPCGFSNEKGHRPPLSTPFSWLSTDAGKFIGLWVISRSWSYVVIQNSVGQHSANKDKYSRINDSRSHVRKFELATARNP